MVVGMPETLRGALDFSATPCLEPQVVFDMAIYTVYRAVFLISKTSTSATGWTRLTIFADDQGDGQYHAQGGATHSNQEPRDYNEDTLNRPSVDVEVIAGEELPAFERVVSAYS